MQQSINVLIGLKGAPDPLSESSHFFRKKTFMIYGGTILMKGSIPITPLPDAHFRIDMFLLDSCTLLSGLQSSIGYITWSDHALITLTLSSGPVQFGNSPWRLNTYLLKSPEIVLKCTMH